MTIQTATVGDIMSPPIACFPDRKFPTLISSYLYKSNPIPLTAFTVPPHTLIVPNKGNKTGHGAPEVGTAEITQ